MYDIEEDEDEHPEPCSQKSGPLGLPGHGKCTLLHAKPFGLELWSLVLPDAPRRGSGGVRGDEELPLAVIQGEGPELRVPVDSYEVQVDGDDCLALLLLGNLACLDGRYTCNRPLHFRDPEALERRGDRLGLSVSSSRGRLGGRNLSRFGDRDGPCYLIRRQALRRAQRHGMYQPSDLPTHLETAEAQGRCPDIHLIPVPRRRVPLAAGASAHTAVDDQG